MKISLSTHEATNLFSQLANADKVTALEAELASLRIDLEQAHSSKRDAWARNDRLESEAYDLRSAATQARREVSAIRAEVLKLQDQLVPFRKERALANVFFQFSTGQKIFAIKALRELYHPLGLREAKECVEGVAPKEENVRDEIHREISELALIFREYHTASPDVQRERLRPFVKLDASVDIASVLNGTFKVETPDNIKF